MEPGELIFIETSGEDAASTMMLAVNTKREEGYALYGGLVPAGGFLGQWMQHEVAGHQYKLVRATTAGVLEEAVRVLREEGWEPHEGTVFHLGKYLQWMKRPAFVANRSAMLARGVPVAPPSVYTIDA